MNELANRMMRAARLEPAVYEDVEHDPTTTFQAAMVVVLASVAGGIGTVTWDGNLFAMLMLGATANLGGWVIWSVLTWAIGTKLLPEATTEADVGQLLRTLGFAAAPGVLRIFGILPGVLGDIALFVVNIWVLAAFIVATRQALDYESTWRAAGVCIVGFVVLIVVQALLIAVVGGPDPTPLP